MSESKVVVLSQFIFSIFMDSKSKAYESWAKSIRIRISSVGSQSSRIWKIRLVVILLVELMAQGRDQFWPIWYSLSYRLYHGYVGPTVSKSSTVRGHFILERSFEDDEYNEDEIVLTSFELEYEIEIQKRFRQLQKIFADKKAELARIAQAGFQKVPT